MSLAGGSAQTSSSGQWRALAREALARSGDSDRKLEQFSYLVFTERKHLLPDGGIKSVESWLAQREWRDGAPVLRLVERNGKPLNDSERREEEAKLEKRRAERSSERRQETAWLEEIPEAMDWSYAGEQVREGRVLIVMDCAPRPGYEPKNSRAQILRKVRGRVWLDKLEKEVVRVEAEVYDTVRVGWGLLAKIEKGTRFCLERIRLSEGAWLPESQTVRFRGRVLLWKAVHQEITTRFQDYRRQVQVAAGAP